uniref:Lectin n=1 Tax=Euperipatoides rowelli TaxID=49087 RepID=D9IX75_EUPRO|nr:lectin [Euperipatoides rowelli]
MAVNFLSVLLLSTLVLLTLVDFAKSESKTICENGQEAIQCPKNGAIDILDGTYGRQSTAICVNPSLSGLAHINTNCNFDATNVLKGACNGKDICIVKANNNWIGQDPCWGQVKYLTVHYICRH